jgi:hypothetical protein
MAMSTRPQCHECDTLMIAAPRPLMRVFGDVRAWECPTCNYMLLSAYPVPASDARGGDHPDA